MVSHGIHKLVSCSLQLTVALFMLLCQVFSKHVLHNFKLYRGGGSSGIFFKKKGGGGGATT